MKGGLEIELLSFGEIGLPVSRIAFGTALTVGTEIVSEALSDRLLQSAWNCGVRVFDTSNNYGSGLSESMLGRSLNRFPREQYVLSTKGSWPLSESKFHQGLSRKHLNWSLDKSLERLGRDYVDIYYAHRYDPSVSMTQIVRTFNHFIQEGKILHWATSQWPLSALKLCLKVCDQLGLERPVAEQIGYSYVFRGAEESGTKDLCERNGIGLFAFSPLAQGVLTGKYFNSIPPESRIAKSDILNYQKTSQILTEKERDVRRFLFACKDHGVSPVAAALQWVERQGVVPLLGASSPEQLEENCRAIRERIPTDFWDAIESSKGSVN